MAHFAKINNNNIVEQIITISNSDCNDLEFPSSEEVGQQFLINLGFEGIWKQTSYNSSFRKMFAGIGFTYSETLDAFIPPNPYPSWVLNTETCIWESPIDYPNDSNKYYWVEDSKSWDLSTNN